MHCRPGVPFTLGYVPLTDCVTNTTILNSSLNTKHKRNNNYGYHSISPYPSLCAHCQFTKHSTQYKGKENPCDSEGLVNVVDVYLGPDGILWILDIGVVDTLTSPDRTSKPKKYNDPKVLGIDVTTGTVSKTYNNTKFFKNIKSKNVGSNLFYSRYYRNLFSKRRIIILKHFVLI